MASRSTSPVDGEDSDILEEAIPSKIRTKRHELKRHLEYVVRNSVDLINSRNSDPYAWRHYHPDLSTTAEQATGVWGNTEEVEWVPITNGLAAWLEFLAQRAERRPNNHVELLEVKCSRLNAKAGYATVIAAANIHGLWKSGIKKSILMVCDFRKEEGDVWRVVKQTSMAGVWS